MPNLLALKRMVDRMSGASSDLTLHFIVATDNHGAFQYDVDAESYKHVQLVNTGTSGAKLEVDV